MSLKAFFVIGVSCMCFSLNAHAAVVVSLQNQEVSLPVNAELGTILQLPGAVRTITPSKYYSITDLGGEASGNAPKGDVRTFQIKPIPNAHPESVTFILAGGKTVALKLISTNGADKFTDVQFERAQNKTTSANKFLGNEVALMQAMLLDLSGGFVREVVEEKTKTLFDGMEFSLLRVYSSSDATGYVYRVRNTSDFPYEIRLSNLVIGKPNRAVLAQVDRERLEPCRLFSPTKECTTALRFVVRGTKQAEPSIEAASHNVPPFVKTTALPEGSPQQ